MSKVTKLVYQVFNTKTNQTETKSVTVNKKNKGLVEKGIKYERDSNIRMARRLFTYTFLELNKNYFNRDFKISSQVEMSTRRPGVVRGFKQKIDIILTNNKGISYAINFANESFSQINPVAVSARSNHVYKTYRGRAYTFIFKDFMDIASQATKYANEILALLEEFKQINFVSSKHKLPTMQQIRACIDSAAERVINEDEIMVVKH